MNRLRVLLLASAAIIPSASLAQDVITLDEIVISAGLTPLVGSGYGRAHFVLNSQDIENRGITTAQDALRALPGVSVSSGSLTQVRMRGAEANHTLILIDGIEAAGGADEYYLDGLETANIDRIELLRGPQSVYYGSNASAGVINIITNKGEPGLHYGGSVELGSGSNTTAYVSQRGENGGIILNLSHLDDHGFDQSGDGGEKDERTRKSIGLSADWQATPDLRFGTTLRRSQEDYDYDQIAYTAGDSGSYVVDDPNLYGETNEFQGAIWTEYSMLNGRLTHRLEYQDTINKRSSDGGPVTRGETEKLKYRLSYGLDGQPVEEAAHLLNFLIEKQEDSSSIEGYERKMNSVALEYRGFLDNGFDIQAGLRRDDNKTFEDFTSWNLGLSWQIPDRPVRLHASAGRALVNPSYDELFDTPYTIGNPNLKPEINRGFDLGVEVEFADGRGTVDLTYFKEKLEDEITYVPGPGQFDPGTSVNSPGESPREGVEIAGQFQVTDALDLALNYTYLDAKDPDGSVEIRRPRHELGLSATYAFARADVTASLRHVSGNFDTQFWGAFETVEIPSYTTVDLAAGYDLTDNIRLTGRVTNLFDKEYSDTWGFASRDRTAYVGLLAKW